MNQVIASNLSLGSETYVALSAPNNCGTFIFNVDEATFTEDMKRDLSSVRLQIYNKAGNEYIPIKDRSVLWNMGKDQSLVIYGIPSSCYVGVNVIVDSTNKIVIDTFPVSIEFDDSPVASSVIFAEKTKQDIADMISGDLTAIGNKIDGKASEIREDISNLSTALSNKTSEVKGKIDDVITLISQKKEFYLNSENEMQTIPSTAPIGASVVIFKNNGTEIDKVKIKNPDGNWIDIYE